MKYLLGIDFGGGASKATLLCEDGAICATYTTEYPTDYQEAGYAEQNPEDWVKATCKNISGVLEKSKVSPDEICAVSLDAATHTAVIMDENFQVIRPAIYWTDTRSISEVKYLKENYADIIDKQVLHRADTIWSLPELLWIKNNEPENWSRVHKILFAKDYVRHCLTGDYVTDYIEAEGSMMFDINTMNWSKELCGRQSIDGDTAQVGPMLSQMLKIPLITNALNVGHRDNKVFANTRMGEESVGLPALVTVERGYILRFPSIFSKIGNIQIIDNEKLRCDASRCGFSGSPTKVLDVFENERGKRKCKFISMQDLFPLIEELMKQDKCYHKNEVAGKKLKSVWADCTMLETDGENLIMYRPAQGGNITAKIKCDTLPQMATVRTKSKSSDIIVAGGKGVFERIDRLEKLAKKLNAEMGASRGLVDLNGAGYEQQIGLTGKTISPKIYIAAGISGAIHHTCAIEGSETVIAINPDKNARIFEYADYGIVDRL